MVVGWRTQVRGFELVLVGLETTWKEARLGIVRLGCLFWDSGVIDH